MIHRALRRRLAPALIASAVIASVATATATATAAAAASAASPDDCSSVSAGPGASRENAAAGYFRLHVAPDESVHEQITIANPSTHACRVELQAGNGITAQNSGNTYAAVSGSDRGTPGTWVRRLLTRVIVPAHQKKTVPFTVQVPADAHPGQYLAGIIVVPQLGDPSAKAAGQVQVVVGTRIGIGVAIRVPGPLSASVSIASVRADTDGVTQTIDLVEQNTGNTWEHPEGTVTVAVGDRRITLPVESDTLLAGGHAQLRVAADAVPTGTHPATARLTYDGGARTAKWQGSLIFDAVSARKAPDGTVIRTERDDSSWSVFLAVAVSALLLVVLVLLALLRRGRKRSPRAAAS